MSPNYNLTPKHLEYLKLAQASIRPQWFWTYGAVDCGSLDWCDKLILTIYPKPVVSNILKLNTNQTGSRSPPAQSLFASFFSLSVSNPGEGGRNHSKEQPVPRCHCPPPPFADHRPLPTTAHRKQTRPLSVEGTTAILSLSVEGTTAPPSVPHCRREPPPFADHWPKTQRDEHRPQLCRSLSLFVSVVPLEIR